MLAITSEGPGTFLEHFLTVHTESAINYTFFERYKPKIYFIVAKMPQLCFSVCTASLKMKYSYSHSA